AGSRPAGQSPAKPAPSSTVSEPPALGAVLGCVVLLEELPPPPHAAVTTASSRAAPPRNRRRAVRRVRIACPVRSKWFDRLIRRIAFTHSNVKLCDKLYVERVVICLGY